MELPKELSLEGLEVGSREYVRMANRRYYYRHKEQEKSRSKAWCATNTEKRKAWAEKNKERRRANGRRCEYGLEPEQFEKMLKEQDGICPICLRKMKRIDVDHCHQSKKIRGLLCHRCNTMIGFAQDSIELLQRAIKYLQRIGYGSTAEATELGKPVGG